jgi:hypothetical protein
MIGRFVPKDWDAAGFKMLVSKFGTFGTQTGGRCHEYKQTLDKRRTAQKQTK